MSAKEIDWSNLGFGYIKTDWRYVANYKDGKWDDGTLSQDENIVLNECAGVLQYAQTCFEGLKAYTTEDGRVVIKLESDFIRTMVSREGAPEALRAALSVLLGHKLESDAVCFEVENAPVTGDSLLDLIIEAAEE